jgi:hypothetical protein
MLDIKKGQQRHIYFQQHPLSQKRNMWDVGVNTCEPLLFCLGQYIGEAHPASNYIMEDRTPPPPPQAQRMKVVVVGALVSRELLT